MNIDEELSPCGEYRRGDQHIEEGDSEGQPDRDRDEAKAAENEINKIRNTVEYRQVAGSRSGPRVRTQ